MYKTYQSITFVELHLSVLIDKSKHYVDFVGGSTYPRKQNGIYRTDNEDIQKYLEKSPSFNKEWRLLYSGNKVVYKEPDQQTYEQRMKELEKENHELKAEIVRLKELPPVVVSKPTKSYPEVLNTQGAKKVLVDEYKVPFNKLPNKKSIENAALKEGVEFPNWKK